MRCGGGLGHSVVDGVGSKYSAEPQATVMGYLASADFTTIEVWTRNGLATCYLLFVMELATRRVHFAGCTPNPDEEWMLQVARNLRVLLNDCRPK